VKSYSDSSTIFAEENSMARLLKEKTPSYKCDECNKTFSTKSYLKDHKYVHQEEFRFNCGVCGGKFKQSSIYRDHMRSCGRDLKCDKCGKTFSKATYLKDHKYVHQEEFRFNCGVCGAKFKQRSVFRYHRRSCGREFKCDKCGKTFSKASGLRAHAKRKNCEFKIPEISPITRNELPPKESNRKRKRKNLKIQARKVINQVMHYHLNKKNKDGSFTPRWLPVFEVEDFEDVLEFEKFMAKVEIGSEEDIFKPEADFFSVR